MLFGLLDGAILGVSIGIAYGLLKFNRSEVGKKWKASPGVWVDWAFALLFYLIVLHAGLNPANDARPQGADQLSFVSPGLRNTLVVGGVFAVTFAYSHFVSGGLL